MLARAQERIFSLSRALSLSLSRHRERVFRCLFSIDTRLLNTVLAHLSLGHPTVNSENSTRATAKVWESPSGSRFFLVVVRLRANFSEPSDSDVSCILVRWRGWGDRGVWRRRSVVVVGVSETEHIWGDTTARESGQSAGARARATESDVWRLQRRSC